MAGVLEGKTCPDDYKNDLVEEFYPDWLEQESNGIFYEELNQKLYEITDSRAQLERENGELRTMLARVLGLFHAMPEPFLGSYRFADPNFSSLVVLLSTRNAILVNEAFALKEKLEKNS